MYLQAADHRFGLPPHPPPRPPLQPAEGTARADDVAAFSLLGPATSIFPFIFINDLPHPSCSRLRAPRVLTTLLRFRFWGPPPAYM